MMMTKLGYMLEQLSIRQYPSTNPQGENLFGGVNQQERFYHIYVIKNPQRPYAKPRYKRVKIWSIRHSDVMTKMNKVSLGESGDGSPPFFRNFF